MVERELHMDEFEALPKLSILLFQKQPPEAFLKGLQLYQKNISTQVFSYEICEIFKNTYFEEHLVTADFVVFDELLAKLLTR